MERGGRGEERGRELREKRRGNDFDFFFSSTAAAAEKQQKGKKERKEGRAPYILPSELPRVHVPRRGLQAVAGVDACILSSLGRDGGREG